MNFIKNRYITIILVLLNVTALIGSCNNHRNNAFTGHYYNSSKDNVLQSIEIINNETLCDIKLYYRESLLVFTDQEIGDEIIIELENGNELHLYMNEKELRVYNIIEKGYQPEDIEWTFYLKK